MVNESALRGHAVGVPWIVPVYKRMTFATGREIRAVEILPDDKVRLFIRDAEESA